MFFTTRKRVLGIFGPFAIAAAFGLSALGGLTGCGALWDHLLGPLHEGQHRIQPTTAADIQRGRDVIACLQSWARANGHPEADYSDVDPARLVIVRVGGQGVIGYADNGKTSFQTDERENGDTIFINEGVSNSEFVGIERHGFVHIPQPQHRELIGPTGDIHWAPPWDHCRVVRAIVSSG